MSKWGDHKEYQRHRMREALRDSQKEESAKWFSFAGRLSKPEMILLMIVNVAIVGGVVYLVVS